MKEFLEKYKNNEKYKNRVQFLIYTIFFVIVTIYALSGTSNINNNEEKLEYNYQMNININDKIYKYTGTKLEKEITINKTVDDTTYKYVYKDNQYFKYETNIYVSVEEKEIYDVIEFSYLSLNTIDKYLKLAIQNENHTVVYLKDIIIGNNSEEYITIETREGYYNIDYTQLMRLLKKDIEKLTVEIIIE